MKNPHGTTTPYPTTGLDTAWFLSLQHTIHRMPRGVQPTSSAYNTPVPVASKGSRYEHGGGMVLIGTGAGSNNIGERKDRNAHPLHSGRDIFRWASPARCDGIGQRPLRTAAAQGNLHHPELLPDGHSLFFAAERPGHNAPFQHFDIAPTRGLQHQGRLVATQGDLAETNDFPVSVFR